MKAEDLKEWLCKSKNEEKVAKKGESRYECAADR